MQQAANPSIGGQLSALSDDELLQVYGPSTSEDLEAENRTWVRFNFIASIDGSATVENQSGGLGTDGDRRLFHLLRRPADALLVGAGTVRAEGYEGELLDLPSQKWRVDRGLAPHPAIAVITGTLDMDPAAAFFTDAPVRPLLLTCAQAPTAARNELSAVAEIVDCGERGVDPWKVRHELARRGHRLIHAEGGPAVLGSFSAAKAVDEMCLTLSPLLAGPHGMRILSDIPGSQERMSAYPQSLQLRTVLQEDSALFLQYLGHGSQSPLP